MCACVSLCRALGVRGASVSVVFERAHEINSLIKSDIHACTSPWLNVLANTHTHTLNGEEKAGALIFLFKPIPGGGVLALQREMHL